MKRVLIAIIVCLLVAPVVLSITQNQTTKDAIPIRDALRRGGLREAAKLKGNYVAEYDPHWHWGDSTLRLSRKAVPPSLLVVLRKNSEPVSCCGW